MSAKRQRHTSCDTPLARSVRVVGDYIDLKLVDGREFQVPLEWFPGLRLAPERIKRRVKLDSPAGITWPDIGYELGVGGLVRRCQAKQQCKPTTRSTR